MNRYQSSGFTLIELILVVGIIAILASVAMGFYGSYVIEANRTDARVALSATSTSLEKCRSIYSAYNSGNCNVAFPVDSDEGLYEVTATVLTATTFTLTATPVSGGAQTRDTDCTTLTLTNTGLEGGTGADITECW